MWKWIMLFLKVLLVLFLFVIFAVALLLWLGSKRSAAKEKYYEDLKTDFPLEQKYALPGPYTVISKAYELSRVKYGPCKVWYPADLENTDKSYPLVVMVNGSGVKASKYEPIFVHLASWGFIVIGNEDGSSWSGESSATCLDLMISENSNQDSIFFGKIDLEHVGIAGHSQGGVGTINAATSQNNAHYYKAIYAASTTHLALAEALKWPYDISQIKAPCFLTAGTLKNDAGNGKDVAGIAPLWSLQENYNAIDCGIRKIYARRVGIDHGDVLLFADSYMTAWFLWLLCDDGEAANVFTGEEPEIYRNSNWQDIESNIPR